MPCYVELWTYQGVDFSLISGVVDHEKSPYSKTVAAYHECIRKLAQVLDTEQIIWCLSDKCHLWHKTSIKQFKYTLFVPEDAILSAIDMWAWEAILGLDTVPKRLRHKYKNPWNVLTGRHWSDPDTTVLLRHPLDPSWIKKQESWWRTA